MVHKNLWQKMATELLGLFVNQENLTLWNTKRWDAPSMESHVDHFRVNATSMGRNAIPWKLLFKTLWWNLMLMWKVGTCGVSISIWWWIEEKLQGRDWDHKGKMIAWSLGHWEWITETRSKVNEHTLSCGILVELSCLWHKRTLQTITWQCSKNV